MLGLPWVLPGEALFTRIGKMTDRNQRTGIFASRRNRIVGAMCITGFCYFIFCVTGRLCTYTDNLTISVVTGGMYGENNFCQYLHPLLCLLIKVLNPIFSGADVLMLVT